MDVAVVSGIAITVDASQTICRAHEASAISSFLILHLRGRRWLS